VRTRATRPRERRSVKEVLIVYLQPCLETSGGTEPDRIEEVAHRVAWAAVKKRYRKVGDGRVPREFAISAQAVLA
jgi:cation transport regulator ChaB